MVRVQRGMMDKKKWMSPILIVLVRLEGGQERVLEICKAQYYPAADPGMRFRNCWKKGVPLPCILCHTAPNGGS